MRYSLKAQLGLLFLCFAALFSLSAMATLRAIEAQEQDAVIINLAGRQRMLVQQMTHDTLHWEQYADEASRTALADAAHTFEQTLDALVAGGPVIDPPDRTVLFPAAQDPETLAALKEVQDTWTIFRTHVGRIAATEPGAEAEAAVHAIERLSPELVRQADEVVRRYQAAAERKIARLRRIQVAFLLTALAVLAAGFLLFHRSLVQPLHRLGLAAERIGSGDLNTPVVPSGPQETAHLARSFDAMRRELATAQQAQQQLTEELEARVAQRTRELDALHEVIREIVSQLETRHVLQSVTDKATALLGADVAVLCLLESEPNILAVRASTGPPQAVCGQRTSALLLPADRVLAAERALPCGAGECHGCCGVLARPFRASHLVAPLRIGPRVIGALCVGSSKEGRFSEEAVHLLTELAGSAAIALENARLFEQAERAAALEARQRIAAEMHDGLAQMVSYLGLQLDRVTDLVTAGENPAAIEQLQRLRPAIEQASAEVRRAITSLQQDPQPPQALQERLARLVDQVSQEGKPPVDLVLSDAQPLILPPDMCEEVLRVVGEALQNARRHAEAGRIVVRLERGDGEASVVVEDDGRGFDPAAPLEGNRHFGLSIMRARAARLGGRLAVNSEPGRGTHVSLSWPLGGG